VLTADLHDPRSNSSSGQLRIFLPISFQSFLHMPDHQRWSKLFTDSRVFDARRPTRGDNDLFIDGPSPLSDMFYLLQIIYPGMLLIYRIDEIDDVGENETIRALPRKDWVQQHDILLKDVLGGAEKYDNILQAAGDSSRSFRSELISRWDGYDARDDDDAYYTSIWGEREVKDYAACGIECGYCGTCEY
jgi:hypothetical protein